MNGSGHHSPWRFTSCMFIEIVLPFCWLHFRFCWMILKLVHVSWFNHMPISLSVDQAQYFVEIPNLDRSPFLPTPNLPIWSDGQVSKSPSHWFSSRAVACWVTPDVMLGGFFYQKFGSNLKAPSWKRWNGHWMCWGEWIGLERLQLNGVSLLYGTCLWKNRVDPFVQSKKKFRNPGLVHKSVHLRVPFLSDDGRDFELRTCLARLAAQEEPFPKDSTMLDGSRIGQPQITKSELGSLPKCLIFCGKIKGRKRRTRRVSSSEVVQRPRRWGTKGPRSAWFQVVPSGSNVGRLTPTDSNDSDGDDAQAGWCFVMAMDPYLFRYNAYKDWLTMDPFPSCTDDCQSYKVFTHPQYLCISVFMQLVILWVVQPVMLIELRNYFTGWFTIYVD